MFVVSFECRKSIEVQSWNTDFTHILRMRELKKKSGAVNTNYHSTIKKTQPGNFPSMCFSNYEFNSNKPG